MLLAIDVLIDFLDPWRETDRLKLVGAIGSLVQAFRTAGHPIVWVRQQFDPDLSLMRFEKCEENTGYNQSARPCLVILRAIFFRAPSPMAVALG
jgi:nicotinamidase-related amidase